MWALSSQVPASEASEGRVVPASGEPAARARVLLLRPLSGFLRFFSLPPFCPGTGRHAGFYMTAKRKEEK